VARPVRPIEVAGGTLERSDGEDGAAPRLPIPVARRRHESSIETAARVEKKAPTQAFNAAVATYDGSSSTGRRDESSLCYEQGVARSLRLCEDFERGKRRKEFTGTYPEGTGTDIDRTQRGNGQEPASCEAFDDLLVKPSIPEQIAHDDIDRRTVRESAVEIDYVEPAAAIDTASLRQFACKPDRDRRHVDSPNLQSAPRQPHGEVTPATRKLQDLSSSGKKVLVRSEKGRRIDVDGSRPDTDVPLIPMDAVLLGHTPNHTS
jgi:hypothetical protein